MEIILNDKNGVVLHTAKKHCKEDITVRVSAEELNITPSQQEQIQEGLFNKVKIQGVTSDIDENIKPENIKAGSSILGVDGNYEGVDTSDATATAGDMLKDTTAYVNNKKITGTIETYDGSYSGEISTTNEWEEIFMSSIDNSLGENITKLPESLTSIRDYGFYKCTNLALTKLPENLTSIGERAFSDCTNLQLTELPENITALYSYTFYNCSKLAITEVPAAVDYLGVSVFQNCIGLKEINLKGKIGSFNSSCFNGCSNLVKLILSGAIGTLSSLASTNVLSGTPIAKGTGYIYVPDESVDKYKAANVWKNYANQIKPISELEV